MSPLGEVYWWNSIGESELWLLVGPQTFLPEVAPSGNGFPVGHALR